MSSSHGQLGSSPRHGVFVPPPPVGPGLWARRLPQGREPIPDAVAPPAASPVTDFRQAMSKPRSQEECRAFDAELDAAELDDRDRPLSTWSARAREISRGHLVLASRRMCYEDRLLVLAVHLIDARPVPLFGRVTGCEYDGDGLYRIEVALLPMPEVASLTEWITARAR